MYSLGITPPEILVYELVAASGAGGLQVYDDVTVLATASGLAHVAVFDLLHRLADGFAVGHLRLAHVGVHPELPQHPVHQNLEVKLAHAADDRLAGLLVGVDLECGVLF